MSRGGSGAFRAQGDSFFNVTLEYSHYDLRLSSRAIPWRKRKMRGGSEFPTKILYIVPTKR